MRQDSSSGVDDVPTLLVPKGTHETLVEAALEGAPREVCGVLGGEFGRDRSRVRSVYPATNAAETPQSRYRIDPEEQLEIFERLEARGEDIVGFYHSHPRGPSAPSETDVEGATWPDRSYVIVFGSTLEVEDGSSSESKNGSSLESGAEPTLVFEDSTAQDVAVGSWRWRDSSGAFERERLCLLE